MAETVAQYQQTAYVSPVAGESLAASVVLGNDNNTRASHNLHDADPGIHLQSSVVGSRPAASIVGRKWYTTDTKKVYYDNGATWDEIAYLGSAGGTLTGGLTVSAGGITVTGNSTITGTLGGITALTASSLALSGAITGLTDLSLSGNLTLSGTAKKIIGSATSTQFRNTADSADFLKFTETGSVLDLVGTTINIGTAGAAVSIGGSGGGSMALATQAGGTFTLQAAGTANVVVSTTVLTTATVGFLVLPMFSGTPTGVAADGAFGYDKTADRLWVSRGGTWRKTAVLTT